MKIVLRTLLAVSLLVGFTPYAMATCQADGCIGPCNYEEILFDTGFSGNCADWVKTGGTSRIQVGSNWKIELASDGTLTQTQLADTYANGMELAYSIVVVPGTAGTERLHVQILQGSTVVETVAIYSPSDTTPSYNGPIGNYSDTAVSVRFRYVPGASPGTTKFNVDNVQMWGFF